MSVNQRLEEGDGGGVSDVIRGGGVIASSAKNKQAHLQSGKFRTKKR